jgi:hypothetical protein
MRMRLGLRLREAQEAMIFFLFSWLDRSVLFYVLSGSLSEGERAFVAPIASGEYILVQLKSGAPISRRGDLATPSV